VLSVSVWDRRPTPAALLAERLSSGWRPRPSLLKEGDAVEGYAACAVVVSPEGEA
jgi:hypothetical protein